MIEWGLIAFGAFALYLKHISGTTSTRILLLAVALMCFMIGGLMIFVEPIEVPDISQ